MPAARGCPALTGSCANATSESAQASSCTSTSRSSVVSGGSASASTKTAANTIVELAGATCTSRSTTTRASPTPNCSTTSAAPAAPRSCDEPPAGTPSAASRSNASSQTTRKAYHGTYWAAACDELAIGRRYTKPYSPWTNGKAEALIKTMLREWAYRHSYPTSGHRARALSGYLRWYNNHRPHGSLGALPPISRVSHVRGYST